MQQKYCICRVNKNKLQYENHHLHQQTGTRTQDQQIHLRGIQPYLQQWRPHLLPHRYGTQERTPGKWADNVEDLFDPITESDFIEKYRTKSGAEMEVLHSFRGSFVHMVGTELEMRYMDAETLARKITRYGFKQF